MSADLTVEEAWMCTLVSLRKVELETEELRALEQAMLDAIDAVMAKRDALQGSVDLFKVSAAHYQRVAGLPSVPGVALAASLAAQADARAEWVADAKYENRCDPFGPREPAYVPIGRITK